MNEYNPNVQPQQPYQQPQPPQGVVEAPVEAGETVLSSWSNPNPQPQQPYQQPQQPYQQPKQSFQQTPQQAAPRRRNGIGTTGFIFTLLGLIFCWVPIVNLVFWFLGILFSFIGLFKRPKGLAIVGFILSFISIIVIIILYTVVGLSLFEYFE